MHPAAEALGAWLSAAQEDPNVCDQMKADIAAWFEAGQPLPVPTDTESRIRQAAAALAVATVASCDCGTKSPDPEFHAINCTYASLRMAMARVDRIIDRRAHGTPT
jgi:hypothetical protein